MTDKGKPIRIALFGAAPDTPNMGVSALFVSAVTGLSKHLGPVEFVVFDNGFGRRASTLRTADGRYVSLILCGARGGRRYYRSENLATMMFASRLGALGAMVNEGIRLIDSCDVVLDLSGGDSFSDIYGQDRFNNVYRPKVIAVNRLKPLILLPQTYGPYKDPAVRTLAAAVMQRCDMAWARDADSFRILRGMLSTDYDSEHHFCGMDMAFALEPSNALTSLQGTLRSWIENRSAPLIGFNVSGLIYGTADGGVSAFGLKDDYRETVDAALRRLLDSSDAKIVLISHVMDRPGHYESDQAACLAAAAQLGTRYSNRIAISPASLNQSEVKWLIAQMDWFCGTRMHSAIAGLSSGVPTAAISYSEKTKGVFETCNQGKFVFDPRKLDAALLVDGLLASLRDRLQTSASLSLSLPLAQRAVEDQLSRIAARINSHALR